MRKQWGICGLCLALLLAAGCGQQESTVVRPPMVKVQQAGADTAFQMGSYAGTVKGRYETNLSFQVGGQIVGRSVQAGSRVQAGDVLMVIDPKDVAQQSRAAEAQVASAKAQLELAQANLLRYSQLYEAQAVPAAVLDQYQTSFDAAYAAYHSAQAQAAQGRNALEYTQLTTGADGVIADVTAEVGQVVSAGQKVMTLVQDGEMEVEINVPESRLGEAEIGAPALVSFWAMPDRVLGYVREVSPMADNVARTYRVRIALPEPPDGIMLGMTASAVLGAEEETQGICLLPLSAIYQMGDGPMVWLVTQEDTVELQPVAVASFGDNAVLVKGLSPDDVVVTAGVTKLHPGQKVRRSDQSGGES